MVIFHSYVSLPEGNYLTIFKQIIPNAAQFKVSGYVWLLHPGTQLMCFQAELLGIASKV
jgi:hypothetical protein